MLYDIEECEAETGGRGRRQRGSVGDAAGDYWRGSATRSRSGVGSGRGEARERERDRGAGEGNRRGAERESARRGRSRTVVEGSEGNVAVGSGNLDGGVLDGGSVRARGVAARLSISRERGSSGDEKGKEGEGDKKGNEKGD